MLDYRLVVLCFLFFTKCVQFSNEYPSYNVDVAKKFLIGFSITWSYLG